jgi:hypothetical protein
MISTPCQAQGEAAKAPAPTLHSSYQASDADTGLGGLALCLLETSKGGMEPLTIAISFDGVSIIEGRRALERRFLPSPAPDARGHPRNSFRSWRRRWRAPDPLSTPLATANSRPRTAVGSAGAIGHIEPFPNNALKRRSESGLQNRNTSGFQILDKANPGLDTRAMVRGLKPCPTIGKRLWSQVGPSLKSGSAVLIEGNDHIALSKETAPRFWRAAKLHLLCGLPDWPCPAAH